MISTWMALLLGISAFISGMGYGRSQITQEDITGNLARMQDEIDNAYQKVDYVKQLWLDAEQKAETWERRYSNLLKQIQEQND